MESQVVFLASLEEVQLLSQQDPTRGGLGGNEPLATAIQRAACVLLISHFEGFLKGLAEEFVTELVQAMPDMRRVPQALREQQSVPHLESIVRCNDAGQRAVLLGRLADLALLWNPSAKVDSGRLSPAGVARTVTSAKPDVIDNLFALFGVTVGKICDGDLDVVDRATGDSAPITIRVKLLEVVRCRDAIAHGDADRKLTYADVDRYMAFLQALAKRLCARADAALTTITTLPA